MKVAQAKITRGRACTGKKKLSQAAALRQVKRLEAGGAAPGAVMAYHCPFEDHWHVGHVPAASAIPGTGGHDEAQAAARAGAMAGTDAPARRRS